MLLLALQLLITQERFADSEAVLRGWKYINSLYSSNCTLTMHTKNFLTLPNAARRQTGELQGRLRREDGYIMYATESGNKKTIFSKNEKYMFSIGKADDGAWMVIGMSSDPASDIAVSSKRMDFQIMSRPECVLPLYNTRDDVPLESLIAGKIKQIHKGAEGKTIVVLIDYDYVIKEAKDYKTKISTIIECDPSNYYAPLVIKSTSADGNTVEAYYSYDSKAIKDGYRPCVKCTRTLKTSAGGIIDSEYTYELGVQAKVSDKSQFYLKHYGLSEPDVSNERHSDQIGDLAPNSNLFKYSLVSAALILLLVSFYFRSLQYRKK